MLQLNVNFQNSFDKNMRHVKEFLPEDCQNDFFSTKICKRIGKEDSSIQELSAKVRPTINRLESTITHQIEFAAFRMLSFSSFLLYVISLMFKFCMTTRCRWSRRTATERSWLPPLEFEQSATPRHVCTVTVCFLQSSEDTSLQT